MGFTKSSNECPLNLNLYTLPIVAKSSVVSMSCRSAYLFYMYALSYCFFGRFDDTDYGIDRGDCVPNRDSYVLPEIVVLFVPFFC